MAFRKSIRNRGRRRRVSEFELQLTSLIDILVIILVFLLKTYTASQNNLTTVPGMHLPISASPDVPNDSLQVIITPEAITFENERIVEFVQTAAVAGSTETSYEFKNQDLDEGGRQIRPLMDALLKAKEKSELLRAKSEARDENGNPLPFDGILAIQADKGISYDTIRKIMYTAAVAGYRNFRFLAMKRDG